jgi:Domain of unknown function (DUF929)
MKGAGNRQVSARTATQKTAGRPGDRQKQPAGGRPGAPRGRGGPAPVQIQSRRPSPTLLGLGAIFVVVIVVLVIVLVGVNHSAGPQKGTKLQPVTASIIHDVTNVPESVFTKVGLPSELYTSPSKVKGYKPLTKSGLPVFLYMGAEYCPYCAFERWAMVLALSKFGTFSGLTLTNSSVSDAYPDTATFSFYKATYQSPYLVFEPYELATNQPAASTTACNVDGYACLMSAPTAYANLLENLPAGTAKGSFPFMDFGNIVYQSGASYDPQILAGQTASQIASQLDNPSSPITTAEVGAANYLTGGICTMTKNLPSSVCSAPYVKAAQKKSGVS